MIAVRADDTGWVHTPLGDTFVEVYRQALVDGRAPIPAIMRHYEIGRATAKRWTEQVRAAGRLPEEATRRG